MALEQPHVWTSQGGSLAGPKGATIDGADSLRTPYLQGLTRRERRDRRTPKVHSIHAVGRRSVEGPLEIFSLTLKELVLDRTLKIETPTFYQFA